MLNRHAAHTFIEMRTTRRNMVHGELQVVLIAKTVMQLKTAHGRNGGMVTESKLLVFTTLHEMTTVHGTHK
jgi:hypothetical protein